MAFTRVSISYQGMGRWLRQSTELQTALLRHAEVGVRFAKSIAPVGPVRDPHRTQFRDSIHSVPHRMLDGEIAVRIVAAPVWVEFGRKHREPYIGSHTLRQTAQVLNSPKRRA